MEPVAPSKGVDMGKPSFAGGSEMGHQDFLAMLSSVKSKIDPDGELDSGGSEMKETSTGEAGHHADQFNDSGGSSGLNDTQNRRKFLSAPMGGGMGMGTGMAGSSGSRARGDRMVYDPHQALRAGRPMITVPSAREAARERNGHGPLYNVGDLDELLLEAERFPIPHMEIRNLRARSYIAEQQNRANQRAGAGSKVRRKKTKKQKQPLLADAAEGSGERKSLYQRERQQRMQGNVLSNSPQAFAGAGRPRRPASAMAGGRSGTGERAASGKELPPWGSGGIRSVPVARPASAPLKKRLGGFGGRAQTAARVRARARQEARTLASQRKEAERDRLDLMHMYEKKIAEVNELAKELSTGKQYGFSEYESRKFGEPRVIVINTETDTVIRHVSLESFHRELDMLRSQRTAFRNLNSQGGGVAGGARGDGRRSGRGAAPAQDKALVNEIVQGTVKQSQEISTVLLSQIKRLEACGVVRISSKQLAMRRKQAAAAAAGAGEDGGEGGGASQQGT